MKLDEILCITVNTVTCVFQLNPSIILKTHLLFLYGLTVSPDIQAVTAKATD